MSFVLFIWVIVNTIASLGGVRTPEEWGGGMRLPSMQRLFASGPGAMDTRCCVPVAEVTTAERLVAQGHELLGATRDDNGTPITVPANGEGGVKATPG